MSTANEEAPRKGPSLPFTFRTFWPIEGLLSRNLSSISDKYGSGRPGKGGFWLRNNGTAVVSLYSGGEGGGGTHPPPCFPPGWTLLPLPIVGGDSLTTLLMSVPPHLVLLAHPVGVLCSSGRHNRQQSNRGLYCWLPNTLLIFLSNCILARTMQTLIRSPHVSPA